MTMLFLDKPLSILVGYVREMAPEERAGVVHGFAGHSQDALHGEEPVDRPKVPPGLNDVARVNQLPRIRFALVAERVVFGSEDKRRGGSADIFRKKRRCKRVAQIGSFQKVLGPAPPHVRG